MHKLHYLDLIAIGLYFLGLLWVGLAVVWTLAGESLDFSSSYAGWVAALPVLVIISLLTKYSPEENTALFYYWGRVNR